MENREKYRDIIKNKLKIGNFRDLACVLYELRTKVNDCPKGTDCVECCLKSYEWLCTEYIGIPTVEENNIAKAALNTEEPEATYYNL